MMAQRPARPTQHPSRDPADHRVDLVRDLLAVALLCVVVIAFFWRVALAGRVLAGGDMFTYFYPYWAEATRALRAGRLPLWNSYLFMGSPFLANSQVGVLYPPNWLLWFLFPAFRSVHLTVVLHLCLAALNGYLWARSSFRLGRIGAWTMGATFALGGYLGAQVEHVNQLQGLAWMPLLLTLYDRSSSRDSIPQSPHPRRRIANSRVACVGLAVVVGLVFLAGHTQTAFISLVGLAAYGLGPALWRGLRRRAWRRVAQRAALLVAVAGLGATLAAIQLVPTWELSRLSVRAGGLAFNERVSFSLAPVYLTRALLPGFAEPVPPEHIEHVAYVGIAGLALAAVAIFHLKSQIEDLQSPILLVFLGLFLSLGLYNPLYLLLARFVPGFAHFRVPARWLTLYALGAAVLAGWGADALWRNRDRVGWRTAPPLAVALTLVMGWTVIAMRVGDGVEVGMLTIAGWVVAGGLSLGLLMATVRAPRLATIGLLAVLTAELYAASSALPHSRATAPQAFTSSRPAIAHLVSAGSEVDGPPSRFVSMSDITFDPGDLAEIEVIYGPQLPADSLYDYVVAAKQKEVLSPNLPMAFGISAVDGYDGGVLPLARYVMLQHLFVPDERVSMDGRLRENLAAIPDGRWLGLFNVRHVITDKLRDAWLDGVFYDLQFGARLARGEAAAVADVPQFEATALGFVSYLQGGARLADGTTVAVVEVGYSDGFTRTLELRAGEHTAEGLYGPDVAHAQAKVGGHFWPGQSEGNDYVTRLRWEGPRAPTGIIVRATLPEGELVMRGLSLIDERTGGFQALVLSDQGRFRLAHSGDVKIYENLDVLPRAFLVHRAVMVADDQAALEMMRVSAFDPSVEVVLAGDTGVPSPEGGSWPLSGGSRGGDFVRVAHYGSERVEIEVVTETAGYLVLTDAWYPGWEASVDDEPVTVYRANLLFRAVKVDAGHHRVVLTFRPPSLFVGVGVSLMGLVGLILGAVWVFRR